MHIAIIGAAGMIGRKLTARLVKDGALNSKPIARLSLADVIAAERPAGFTGKVEIAAGDLVTSIHQATSRWRPDGVTTRLLAKDVALPFDAHIAHPDYAMTKLGHHPETLHVSRSFALGSDVQTILTIADADLPALASGNIKSLYQHGKVRIDGDISVAHRLGFLKGVI